MRKVTITERRVYYKVASIEVEIPKDLPLSDTQEWLLNDYENFEQELDEKFNDAELEWGTGVDEVPHMNEPQSVSETRYDVINENYGGHI
tara:strand:+ start:566 stop:835 length:270 start_codon:yes stop_codon:yes gene_type:complete